MNPNNFNKSYQLINKHKNKHPLLALHNYFLSFYQDGQYYIYIFFFLKKKKRNKKNGKKDFTFIR